MNKKLYIHAGFPKTATSAIQEILYSSRDWLHSRGILYPTTGLMLPEKGQHNLLHSSAKNFRPNLDVFNKLSHEIRQTTADTVIISSERFYAALQHCPDLLLRAFREHLAYTTIELVFTVRRADYFFESAVGETL